jgi:hypothetical protein
MPDEPILTDSEIRNQKREEHWEACDAFYKDVATRVAVALVSTGHPPNQDAENVAVFADKVAARMVGLWRKRATGRIRDRRVWDTRT